MTSSTLELLYSPPPRKTSSYATQVAASLAVSLGPLAVGFGKGYSSPALASLCAPEAAGGLALTSQQGSWVASLSLLGALVGGLPAGLALRVGRRRVLAAVSVPFAVSWWLAAAASTPTHLYVAALVSGACSAVVSLVAPVYVSEVAEPNVRGALCLCPRVASSFGLLLSFCLGAWLDWRRLAVVASVAPMLLLLVCCVIPDTPSFLLLSGHDQQAQQALRWLRGGRDVSAEYAVLRANIQKLRCGDGTGIGAARGAGSALLRPLLVTCGLMALQKFCGVHVFSFYAVPILRRTVARASTHGAAAAVAALQMLAGLTSGVLIDSVGRLPLLVVSSALMSASLAGFAAYAHLSAAAVAPQQDWIPLSCVLVCQVAFALGVGPVSWLLLGELFPLRHRGLGAAAASVSYGCAFVSVKTFVDLEQAVGLAGVFALYAGVSAVCLVFTLVFVPETKGTQLPEMEAAAVAT